MFKFNKQVGQVSRLLLVLAVVIFVAVIITFLVLKMADKPPAPVPPTGNEIPLPVYEKQLGNINFIFESAIDRGNTLRADEIVNTQFTSTKDLVISNLGAKFIMVTIGAQNVGTINTEQNAWTIENIVDSKNREFVPLQGYTVNPWLPAHDLCGALLKPAFAPTSCIKIYEVSKESSGLKIRVKTGKDNKPSNMNSGKAETYLIDLIVK